MQRNNQSQSKALVSECSFGIDSDDTWFMGSGATEHMSKRREWFDNYVQLDYIHSVRIGNGEMIYAVGTGTVAVLAFNGERWIEKHY